MRLKLFLIISALVSIILIIAGCAAPKCPDLNEAAPDFTLENPEGQEISLSDFKGKTIILNFWATWCGPCQLEMPFFQAIYEERADDGLIVMAVDVMENASSVGRFVSDMELTFPVLLDTNAKVARQYCLPQALPATLFIDEEGIIRAGKVGAFIDQQEIEDILDSI